MSKLLVFFLASLMSLPSFSYNFKEKSIPRYWVKKKIVSDNPVVRGKFGRIAICTLSTPNIRKYSAISLSINKMYAEKHNYDLINFDDQLSQRHPSWDKLLAILKCLNQKDSAGDFIYSYVFWIDADAYFNKFSLTIESIISSEYQLSICDDEKNNIVNCGVMLFKNTEYTRNFVNLWWKSGKNSSLAHEWPWEQHMFKEFYLNDFFGIQSNCIIRQSDFFNSNPRLIANNKFKSGWNDTFIIHLMGVSMENRCKVLSQRLQSQKTFLSAKREEG